MKRRITTLFVVLGITLTCSPAFAKKRAKRPRKKNSKVSLVSNTATQREGTDPTKKQKIEEETAKHLERLAQIQRIADLAAERGDKDLLERAKSLAFKEKRRHGMAVRRIKNPPPPRGEAADSKEADE